MHLLSPFAVSQQRQISPSIAALCPASRQENKASHINAIAREDALPRKGRSQAGLNLPLAHSTFISSAVSISLTFVHNNKHTSAAASLYLQQRMRCGKTRAAL